MVSFAETPSKTSENLNEIGLFLKFASYDKKQAHLEYIIGKEKRNVSLELSDIYGVHSAFPITQFLYFYGNLHYQYIQVFATGRTNKSDIETMDAHEFILGGGVDLRLSLYKLTYFPLSIQLNVKAGVELGYAVYADSKFKNTPIYGYSHAIGLYFHFYHHYFINTGIDWNHHYSRAYAKDKKVGTKEDNTLLLDFDNSGRFYISLGYAF